MDPTRALEQRKTEILGQLAALGSMRKGSLTEQYLPTRRKDGTQTRRGPYTLYTFKERGQKTVSRRLGDPAQAQLYRQQITAFRRFQELTTELVQVSQRLADLEAAGQPDEGKKNSRR